MLHGETFFVKLQRDAGSPEIASQTCYTMQSDREISSNKFHEKVSPCNIGLSICKFEKCSVVSNLRW